MTPQQMEELLSSIVPQLLNVLHPPAGANVSVYPISNGFIVCIPKGCSCDAYGNPAPHDIRTYFAKVGDAVGYLETLWGIPGAPPNGGATLPDLSSLGMVGRPGEPGPVGPPGPVGVSGLPPDITRE